MSENINWPAGEFTIQAAVACNPKLPQAELRKKLSAAIAAKKIIQTKKGNGKVQGAFQVVKTLAGN